ncbi:MAG: ABC transporter ATP-binding protein [Methanomicrobiaceae archaeon]|nr:ABC transporter ATP-binding protein [Methanomicrobiaceae archaeon]
MKPVLSLENIKKTYTEDGVTCNTLSGVSFDVFQSEILCIMGPSGCGKSTLLRIIEKLDSEYNGSVCKHQIKDGKSPKNAMIFQEHALFPWLTVFDNIIYGLRLKAEDVSEDEAVSRVNSLLSITRLDKFSDSYPRQLSGGMKQRVSVARALAIRPDILLMDEPFSALDPFTRRELQDEILRIRTEMDMTIVLVTHNPEEAVYLADRVIMLSERPSSVSKIIQVCLPYPRNPADPGFLAVREEISGMVRKQNTENSV